MSTFNESFYTTDFDQEMMDFIINTYEGSDLQWDSKGDELVYGTGNGYFWTNTFPDNKPARMIMYGTQNPLTKQQFKEKIGMPQDNIVEEGTFGKKDLVDGMFVKIKDKFYMVVGETLSSYDLYILLADYDDNLEDYSETEWDITEVFVVDGEDGVAPLKYFLGGNGLKSIWKRTPPKSIKVINLEKLIRMHEEQLEATKKLLAEELSL